MSEKIFEIVMCPEDVSFYISHLDYDLKDKIEAILKKYRTKELLYHYTNGNDYPYNKYYWRIHCLTYKDMQYYPQYMCRGVKLWSTERAIDPHEQTNKRTDTICSRTKKVLVVSGD